jgi:hypothetical protein
MSPNPCHHNPSPPHLTSTATRVVVPVEIDDCMISNGLTYQ